jgi:exopolysaccharide biosynthesis polyprenyl glycosylphosphotransferase
MLRLIESTSREFVDVKVVPDLLQVIALRARLEELDGLPVININDVPLQGLNTLVKRGIDIVISAGALLVLAIPFWIIAAVVKLTSKGDVFYRQERMGLDGRAFTVFKIRSMYQNAEDASGPVWARDDDPRTTPVGRWLRRFDLDELPQFWNVLKGDMSLVGPRPIRPRFFEELAGELPAYWQRLVVRPGLTGFAQIRRGYETSMAEKLAHDLEWIADRSVRLYLRTLWTTALRILKQIFS